MFALLTALLPLLGGITQPLKDYFNYKQELQKKEQDYKLALLQSQVDMAKSQNIADSEDLKNRLSATSQAFKQGTFYPLWAIVLFSVLVPSKAELMWHNFGLMPDWFQWLFLSVYSAIWGLPIMKNGYGAITDLLQSRRDFKLQKETIRTASINETKLADALRKTIFTKGMTQEQWDAIKQAANNSVENNE